MLALGLLVETPLHSSPLGDSIDFDPSCDLLDVECDGCCDLAGSCAAVKYSYSKTLPVIPDGTHGDWVHDSKTFPNPRPVPCYTYFNCTTSAGTRAQLCRPTGGVPSTACTSCTICYLCTHYCYTATSRWISTHNADYHVYIKPSEG